MLTRRSFLYSATALGAASTLTANSLFTTSPSDQINVALIGCGGRGESLVNYFKQVPGVSIAALCDADSDLVDKLSLEHPKASKSTDMRHVFDSPEIDAVIIATSNHWHCLAAIWAMQAGKHVYVEKPLGHTQWEGEQVINASKVYEKICQVGTQQRSDPMQAEIKDFLHQEKAIGEIESVRVNRFGVRESIGQRETPLAVSKSVDYNLWLGPGQDIPIYRDRLNYNWHWDWNTGSGEMGNWGVHILDDVRNNIFLDKVASPQAIVAGGGRYGWNDAGNTPNVHFALLDTGSIPVVVTLSNLPIPKSTGMSPSPTSGYIAYGSQGRLEGQRGHAKAFDGDGNLIKKFKGKEGSLHQKNFIEAIRAGDAKLLNAPVQIGHDSTTWCNLINIATRVPSSEINNATDLSNIALGETSAAAVFGDMTKIVSAYAQKSDGSKLQLGEKLTFDTKNQRFVGHLSEEANTFLRREDRKPFEVPEIAFA